MSLITSRAALVTRPQLVLLASAMLLVAAVASAAILLRAPVPAAAPGAPAVASVMQQVERRAVAENGRMDVQAILATPAYFRLTGQPALAERYAAGGEVVVILTEDIHFGELPGRPRPRMLVDGRAYELSRTDTVFESDHHRTTVLVYGDKTGPLAAANVGLAELELAGAGEPLRWDRPYGSPAGAAEAGLSVPLLLALFGGILASMWPCLFQLTAYFIPSVAGLSVGQIDAGTGRAPVLRTALLFVSGIVVVYTLAGLAAGLAAQSLSSTTLFESARRPLTVVAGLVILAMAARLALRARRPLACAMPIAAPKRSGAIGTVALGLAFATSCMTCFGAAVVLGLFAYVVTTASPLVGAAVLFLFSLGIAVPLVVAAVLMARVLPLLTRLERGAPLLSLASAGIMAVYGVLLVSGMTHVLSNAVASVAGVIR